MPTIKGNCTYYNFEMTRHRLRNCYRPWEHHPSFTLALEALDDYCHWVSEAVLPVAFAWIDEHYDEVYGNIPKEYWDDVGVVIAAAFELVKNTAYYKKGLTTPEKFEKILEKGEISVATLNPVWTQVAEQNSAEVKLDWERWRNLFDGTIHWGEGDDPIPDRK